MNHNLKLNEDAADDVRDAIGDIVIACESARRHIRAQVGRGRIRAHDERYSELLAYIGTIFDAQWRIGEIVFNTDPTDSEYAIDSSAAHADGVNRTGYPTDGGSWLAPANVAILQAPGELLPVAADVCDPHGIDRPMWCMDCGNPEPVGDDHVCSDTGAPAVCDEDAVG